MTLKPLVFAGVVSLTAMVGTVHADPLSVNFCPGGKGCPTGVSEASLTFSEILKGSDPNDYLVTIKIVGNSSSPTYIDEVGFSIDGISTPSGYESLPTISSAPTTNYSAPWSIYFDNIPDCGGAPSSSQMVCAQSTGNGALTNGTNIWTFVVDLSGTTPLSAGMTANLRAQFLDLQNGRVKNAGILSPGGGVLTVVPEPGSLVLLSGGLFLLARIARRRPRGTAAA